MSRLGDVIRAPRLRCDFPWTLAIVGLAVVATAGAFGSPRIADALRADGRIADGQLWRVVTGPLVHATWGHLVRDLALVALAGVAYEAPLRALRVPLFVAGLVVPAVAVLAAGDARWYCGVSGLSHALLAAALSYEVTRRRGAARALVLGLCAVAALKPLYELATGTPAFVMSLGDGVTQVPLAHVVGVLIGIACGLRAARGCDTRNVARATFATHRITGTLPGRIPSPVAQSPYTAAQVGDTLATLPTMQ